MSERSKEGRFTSKISLPELEPEKWWSWKRAKRGFTTTFATMTLLEAGVIGVEIISGNKVIDHPFEIASTLAGLNAANGLAGAFVDGFRPTSRLVKKEIESFIEMKNDFAAIGKGIVKGAKFLAKVDYGKLAYDVLRPDIPETFVRHKRELLTYSTICGGSLATIGYSAAWLFEHGDKFFDSIFRPDHVSSLAQWYSLITEQPLEIIVGGTALGFVAGAYPLIFHRPFRKNPEIVTY